MGCCQSTTRFRPKLFLFDVTTCHDAKIVLRLLCQKRRRSTTDAKQVQAKALSKKLQVFQGFREMCYRLVYENKDALAQKQHVCTILPNGDVEVEKEFQPRPGRGLMTFGYPKEIHQEHALRYTRREEGPGPFIHNNDMPESCAYPLVQTWTVNINKTFHDEFDIMEIDKFQDDEFDIMKVDRFKHLVDQGFHLDAIHAFYQSMVKSFGSAAVKKYPIKCCKMKHPKQNEDLVIVGPRSVLAAFLMSPDMQKYFVVSADEHGFKAWSKPKG